jgi:hypothetical protein
MPFDQFATLAMEAQLAVTVLSNAEVSDVELLPVKPYPLGPEKIQSLAAQWAGRGLQFIGTIGIVDGQPHGACGASRCPPHICALTSLHCILRSLAQQQRGATAEGWLPGSSKAL